LRRSAYGSPTDRRSGSGTRVSNICPGDEAWLIGEHRMSGEKKYYLANLPAKTELRTLAATIKARWICEQAHQQLKDELGLDHFEGRSWQGLHRHALMTMIAYAFLQHRCII
jgi:SRSO17 transposase